jgi:hypothetical protein
MMHAITVFFGALSSLPVFLGATAVLVVLVCLAFGAKRPNLAWLGIALIAGWLSAEAIFRAGELVRDAAIATALANERARVASVNAEAMRWQGQYVADLAKRIAALQEKVKANDEAAAHDPHAARPAISRDGVRRLNQIGR